MNFMDVLSWSGVLHGKILVFLNPVLEMLEDVTC